MFLQSDTQTICVHSSPFVVHRKKKIIGLMIIVFVGIVAVGIWSFGNKKPEDSTKASDRGSWIDGEYDDNYRHGEQQWHTESSNDQYLKNFWNKMENRHSALNSEQITFWRSNAWTYLRLRDDHIQGMNHIEFEVLLYSSCTPNEFADATFVGQEYIICSVANAILMECNKIAECKSRLLWVRQRLMNPDGPGKWCHFGRDTEALHNLNFCLTSHYPILSGTDFNFWAAAETRISANTHLSGLGELESSANVFFTEKTPPEYGVWEDLKVEMQETYCYKNHVCAFKDAVLYACLENNQCTPDEGMFGSEVKGKLDNLLSQRCEVSCVADLYTEFWWILTSGNVGLNNGEARDVMVKAGEHYTSQYQSNSEDPDWNTFVTSLRLRVGRPNWDNLSCGGLDVCAFGDSVLHGCDANSECQGKMKQVKKKLEKAITSTPYVDKSSCSTQCIPWGP